MFARWRKNLIDDAVYESVNTIEELILAADRVRAKEQREAQIQQHISTEVGTAYLSVMATSYPDMSEEDKIAHRYLADHAPIEVVAACLAEELDPLQENDALNLVDTMRKVTGQ